MCAHSAGGATFRTLRRQLEQLGLPTIDEVGAPLEVAAAPLEQSRLIAPEQLESGGPRRIAALQSGFDAFLDGTQQSRPLHYVDGVAVIHGTVAAVIRRRRDRRLSTWRHVVERAVYAPRAAIPAAHWRALERTGARLVDTSVESSTADHPFTLRDAAIHRVQQDREALERRLADEWRADVPGLVLMVDGSLGNGWDSGWPPGAAGVVKSHRSIYSSPSRFREVLNIGAGERSPAFRLAASWREPVISWYLRVRDPGGRDPMWGLLRVELPDPPPDPATIGARVDEVSGWVLSETAPLSLPDARWDKLMYGIHDCEQFLEAVV